MKKAILILSFIYTSLHVAHAQTPSYIYWSGGGVDTKWTTVQNWNPQRLPQPYDIVIFDGRSSKNCTMDKSYRISGFRVDPGYHGTITQSDGQVFLVTKNGFTMNDGRFIAGSLGVEVKGTTHIEGNASFTQTAGNAFMPTARTEGDRDYPTDQPCSVSANACNIVSNGDFTNLHTPPLLGQNDANYILDKNSKKFEFVTSRPPNNVPRKYNSNTPCEWYGLLSPDYLAGEGGYMGFVGYVYLQNTDGQLMASPVRETIAKRLTTPLEKDKRYYIGMDYRLNDVASYYTIANMGMKLSDAEIVYNFSEDIKELDNTTVTKSLYDFDNNEDVYLSGQLTNTTWQRMSGIRKMTKNKNYLYIGGFGDASKRNASKKGSATGNPTAGSSAYYDIDNVEIVPFPELASLVYDDVIVCEPGQITVSPKAGTAPTICSRVANDLNLTWTDDIKDLTTKIYHPVSDDNVNDFSIKITPPTAEGTYIYHLFDWNGYSASDVPVKSVKIIVKKPAVSVSMVASPGVDGVVCGNGAFTLTASTVSTGVTYRWFKNNQPIPNAINATFSIANATASDQATYSVVVTKDGCASDKVSKAVTVDFPLAAANADKPNYCTGESITLTGNSTNSVVQNYYWSGPNGYTSSIQTPVISSAVASNSGTYNLYIVNRSNRTSPIVSSTVNVYNLSAAGNIGGNRVVCDGNANFTFNPAKSYYSLTSSNVSNIPAPYINSGNQLNYSLPAGNYNLSYRYTDVNNCPSATASISVAVYLTPYFNVSNNFNSYCTDQKTTLVGFPPQGYSYGWTGPNGFNSTNLNPSVTLTSQSKTYTFTISNGTCSYSKSIIPTPFVAGKSSQFAYTHGWRPNDAITDTKIRTCFTETGSANEIIYFDVSNVRGYYFSGISGFPAGSSFNWALNNRAVIEGALFNGVGLNSSTKTFSFNPNTIDFGHINNNTLNCHYISLTTYTPTSEFCTTNTIVIAARTSCPEKTFNCPGGNTGGSRQALFDSDSLISPTGTYSLFPNPSTGKFTFYKREEGAVELTIYDMLGQAVWKQSGIEASETEINLSGKPTGIYQLKVARNGKPAAYFKVVVQ